MKVLKFWHYFLFFLIVAGLFLGYRDREDTVTAQSETTLYVFPSTGNLVINGENTIVVELLAENVDNMLGFEVTIAYDPALVQLDAWAKGSLVTTFTWQLAVENTAGHLRLVFAKPYMPAVSGDGVLLQLTFKGQAPGISAISITEAFFSDPSGAYTYPVCGNGSLNVSYLTAPVMGEISLQGRSQRSDVFVTLGIGSVYQQGPYGFLSLDQEGANLMFGEVVVDTYMVATNRPGYLNLDAAAGKTLNVTGAEITLPLLRLLSGNAVSTDNVINGADLEIIKSWFGIMGEALDADVNFDGVVDVRDLALAGGNYGLNSSTAYAGWEP